MSVLEIIFLIVIFLSNIIQAVTGFAGTVLAMPPSLQLVGADVAKPVLNLAALGICLVIAIMHYKDINWKELLIMIIAVGAGFALGFGVELLPINGDFLLKLYGVVIVSIALLYIFVPVEKMDVPKWVLIIILFLGGVLHKLYVSGGPLVVIYALKRFKDKHQFRATLSVMWIILNLINFGQHIANGLFVPHIWLLVGLSFAVSALSFLIGHFLVKKLNINQFMKVTYVLLFISGFSLLF